MVEQSCFISLEIMSQEHLLLLDGLNLQKCTVVLQPPGVERGGDKPAALTFSTGAMQGALLRAPPR